MLARVGRAPLGVGASEGAMNEAKGKKGAL
jgi:hypothetical protein